MTTNHYRVDETVATELHQRQRRHPAPTPLRYAGIAAVAILWITVISGMVRTGLDPFGDDPISYLGTDPTSAPVFRGGLIAAAVLMAGFAWFAYDRFSAPRSFLAVLLIGLVGQVVAAVVLLSGPGPSHAIHTIGGLVLGASLPVMMWRFAAGGQFGPAAGRRRVESYGLCWLEVAACAAGLVLSARGRAPIAEIVPALAFHLWIAVVTAWSAKASPARP